MRHLWNELTGRDRQIRSRLDLPVPAGERGAAIEALRLLAFIALGFILCTLAGLGVD